MSVLKKLLQTTDTAFREVGEIKPEPGRGLISTHSPTLSDAAYVTRFATPDELATLRRLIEKRLAARPTQTYWRCKTCGNTITGGPNVEEPVACLSCNKHAYKDGGWCRQLSAKEIEKYKADRVETLSKVAAQRQAAAFYRANERRQRDGLEPLTREQFDEKERQAFKRRLEKQKKIGR